MSRRPKKFHPEPFDYHEEVELEIDSLTNLGHGVGRVNDWVVFVPFALPGETVLARVYRNTKTYSDADLIEVRKPSPERVDPRCDLFGQCGGCQYQNLSYEAQLRWKQEQVGELLQRMAGIEFPVNPVHASPVEYGYRSKITPHFQRPRDGKISAIGFLLQGRRGQIIDVEHCPIASETINEKLIEVRREAHERAAFYKKGATLLLRDSLDGEVCTDHTVMCEQMVGDLRFSFHAGEFFQNNPHILPAFADHVVNEALGAPDSTGLGQGPNRVGSSTVPYLIDAYCGSGLFCLSGASRFSETVGIEISESSIDWARRNAEQNDIENCRFIQGDATSIFSEVEFPPEQCAVVIDPPRKGSSPEFLQQLIDFGPARVVYVSCNPATQVRDLELLRDAFEIEKIQPFDLFPQTRHLECVVTLRRK